MSRFLFVMFEGGGNVPVQLAIARRLVARGHTARVLGDPAIEQQARAAGCDFVAFEIAPHHDLRNRDADRVRDWSATSPLAQLELMANQLMFGPAELYAREVVDEIDRSPADALAIDYLLFGAQVGAEKTGVPTAVLMHTPYAMPARGVPPFGMALRPARGPFGRLRDRLLGSLQVRTFDKLGKPPVNAARTALGLPPLAVVFDQIARADRTLVMTARGFDFAGCAELPPSVVFTGAELDDPVWAAPWSSPWPSSANEPLVVVALGSTFQDQRAVTQRVIDALAGLPVRGLVTLGGVFAPEELALPPNVVAVRSAPHRDVLPIASVVVAHGGHGTVMKALSFGKPVLCIPLGRDQGDNAVRVEVSGAGSRVKKTASTNAIRRAIARLLDDTSFTDAAKRLATEIARDVAADRAIAELEALARGRTHAVA